MEQLSIFNKNIQDQFLSLLLITVTFSFSYLPLLFLPISPIYFLAISTIILFIYLLYDKTSFKSLFNDYGIFYWFTIFLLWYSIRLLFEPSTQLLLINIEQVYLVMPVVIFLCTNFRYLHGPVSNVLFILSSTYFIFGLIAYFSLSNSIQTIGFINIFQTFNLDFEDGIYQNVGFWIGLFTIYLFNSILEYSNSFKENKFILICLAFGFLMSIIMLLINGARGVFVGLLVALIFRSRKIRDERFIYSSISAILLFLVLIILNQESFLTINRFLNLFSAGDESSRLYLFSKAISLWSQDLYTVLFGAGVKSFPIFIDVNSSALYPHNVFLEILSELGLVGLIIFLKILFLFYKNTGNNELINSFTIFTIFTFCVSGSFDTFYRAFFFLCLGLKNINNKH